MSQVRVHNFSISLDGFGTGDGLTLDAPFGHAGERLHEWMFTTRFWRSMDGEAGGSMGIDHAFAKQHGLTVGAEIMGRGKFGGGPGPWGDDPWPGWWGEDPPFHMPVFVLTHHEREPLTLSDTTFTFVTDGIQSALKQARAAAAGKDVTLGGGADVINQYLAAGLVDELELHVVPLLLGSGARLFEGVGADLTLEQVRAVEAPGVAHLKYRTALTQR